MLVLRCTQKLLKKRPGPENDRVDSMTPVLGDWHANLIRLAHTPIVLCVNDISLLAVLVRGKDFSNLVSAFRSRVVERLERMKIPQEKILAEVSAMEIIRIEGSNSRSVLGSMNDFVHHLKWQAVRGYTFQDVDALEEMLSETPMGSLKYCYPVEVAMAAFNELPNSFSLLTSSFGQSR